MARIRARVVHLSDLHFGGQFDNELKGQVIALVNEHNETARKYSFHLVVSGDIVESPRPKFMLQAARFIYEEIGEKFDHITVIPGNHDYKFKGNIGLRKLSRIPFEALWGMEVDDSLKARLLNDRKERRLRYWALFKDTISRQGKFMRDDRAILCPTVDEKNKIVIIGVNSTPLFELFGFATGKVADAHIRELTRLLEVNEKEWGSFLKIITVHHHPLPVPYSPTDPTSRLQESFMILQGAGAFLRELAQHNVDLILHGHKHIPGISRITYDYPTGAKCSMAIVGAGSATTSQSTTNEVNIIDVYDDDRIKIEQRFFDRTTKKRDETKSYWLHSFDDVRRNKQIKYKVPDYSIGRVIRQVKIREDGNSDIEVTLGDIKCLAQSINSISFEDIIVPPPTILRDFQVEPGKNCSTTLRMNSNKSLIRHWAGTVDLTVPVTNEHPLFDVVYKYRMISGHALNQEAIKRRYAWNNTSLMKDWEYTSIGWSSTVKTLDLSVEFPEKFNMDLIKHVEAIAFYEPNIERGDEERIIHEEETTTIAGSLLREGQKLRLQVFSV